MSASWFGRKEPQEQESATEVPPLDRSSDGSDLDRTPNRIGAAISQAVTEIAEYLGHREPSVTAESSLLAPIVERLERLESALEWQRANWGELTDRICKQVRSEVGQAVAVLGVTREKPEPRPAPSDDWEQAILGPCLASLETLVDDRRQLVAGVLNGEPAACGLAGCLLLFRATPPERQPPLLKDIGEAYYLWQPKTRPGNRAFEEALASWLQKNAEAAGISNTIALVHPGERFDASRHSAVSRGVEITEVQGWIVLRDNGRVYTKAGVTVR